MRSADNRASDLLDDGIRKVEKAYDARRSSRVTA
jgi:hypothetical protein